MKTSGGSNVEVEVMDYSNKISVDALIKVLKDKKHKLDYAILNSGINISDKKKCDAAVAEETLKINFDANMHIISSLLKENLLNNNAKVIQVSSYLGSIAQIKNEDFKKKLQAAKTVSELKDLGKNYIELLKKKELPQSQNVYNPEYSFSKLLVSLSTPILQHDPKNRERNIQFYAMCPGWTKTDMGGPTAPNEVESVIPKFDKLLSLPDSGEEAMGGMFFSQNRFSKISN